MKNKGSIWLIIFVLIIIFVLLNTLAVTSYITPLSVTAREEGGKLALATINEQHPPKKGFTDVTYQAFAIEAEVAAFTLVIDVNNAWREQHHIAPTAVTLYHQTGRGWEPQPTTLSQTFNKENTYRVANASNGTYVVAGTPDTMPSEDNLPSVKAQLGILIIIIIVILFVGYHHSGNKAVIQHHNIPNKKQLDNYIKQCLLAKHDDKEVRERLLKAGWHRKEIDQGLRRARFF
ncbi:hypothetical protein GF367_01095 [Candidatus Woesearchaeota archaeon]|nr:hypothetical protein [Candidatus Woesearchaeota archaeon]